MILRTLVLFAVVALALAAPARAQLNTQHIKGSFGLKAGSQAAPGGYVIAPLLYVYSSDTVRTETATASVQVLT